MADIVVREKGEALVPETDAHVNYMGILAAKSEVGKNFLILGRLLKKNRDDKHFVELGYDTFEDFLGAPEVGLSRSMVFDLIKAVEIFIDGLGRDVEELAPIGISKLSAISRLDITGSPVVYQAPDEWLDKALTLSRSDLNAEVWEVTGQRPVRRSDAPRSTDLKPIGPGEDYIDYVRNSPCCVCGKPSTEAGKSNAAHFPVTRGAGAPKDWVIPLCGECHHEQHQDPVKFMVTYQAKWATWFYYLIATTGRYNPLQKGTPDTLNQALPATTDRYEGTPDGPLVPHPPLPQREDPSLSTPKRKRERGEALERPVKDGGVGSPRNSSAGFAGSSAASPPVADQDSEAPARVPGDVSYQGPPKQIWPPGADNPGGTMVQWDTVVSEPKEYDGNFAKCSMCGTVWPTADLEMGLCEACRPSGSFEAALTGLTFPKPVSRKRRGKKGGKR